MNIHEVVKKLVGKIEPVGETREDERRLENLKVMTELVDNLLSDIDRVAYEYQNCHQASMKRASNFASKFQEQIGLQE